MGLYDTFGKRSIQIKAGPCDMAHYEVGDDVPMLPGIYVGYEGVIVVLGGKFVAEFETLTDKWGGVMSPEEVITRRNPLMAAIQVDGEPGR